MRCEMFVANVRAIEGVYKVVDRCGKGGRMWKVGMSGRGRKRV